MRLKLADDVAYDMTSSMHHDLERGNPLEVRWLAGGVVELGRAKGVATPLNRADRRHPGAARRRRGDMSACTAAGACRR